MPAADSKSSNAAASSETPGTDRVPGHIGHNIDSIIEFYRREEGKLSESQRRLEQLGRSIGRPLYLLVAISIVTLWILYNSFAPALNAPRFDPPPFFWLQGTLSLGAFLTTTVVLIMQNRQAQFEAQRLYLDLQLNLSTEQKTTKLIHLLEELRRDLPMVEDRHDAVAAAMQTATDPTRVLESLQQQAEKDGTSPANE